jgi:hypothetical protein
VVGAVASGLKGIRGILSPGASPVVPLDENNDSEPEEYDGDGNTEWGGDISHN